jgi:hypothetical protein
MIEGGFIAATSCFIPHVTSVDSAAMMAICNGLVLAANIGCNSLMVELDSSNVVGMINQEDYLGQHVAIYMECKQLGADFSKVDVVHCFREANSVADSIAKSSLSSRASEFWDSDIPDFISYQVVNDLAII